MSDTTDDLEGSAWADEPDPIDRFEADVRARMRHDMALTLAQHAITSGVLPDPTVLSLLDALVEDGMHQVYKAWEEGRP